MKAGMLLCALLVASSAKAQWSVEHLPAASGAAPLRQCRMVTPWQSLFDGYQTTQVRLVLDDARLELQSRAPLDSEQGDITLQVDAEAPVASDALPSERVAAFTSARDHLVRQFIPGKAVRIRARFWPTWPQTAVQSADVSLMGFTRAFEAYSKCE